MKLLLLSGGIESTCLAFWKDYDAALTINYGQKSFVGELRASEAVAEHLGIPHETHTVDVGGAVAGLMSNSGNGVRSGLPEEWWPFRNQLLMTIAAMKFYSATDLRIDIGTVCTDARHTDGSPDFVRLASELLSVQIPAFSFNAPAIALTSEELIEVSGTPQSVLGWTFSCHVDEVACGLCPGCLKHIDIMSQLGVR